ncbi:MAG: hypothetical protein V4599_06965 [Verrucomicrobiota bacterium]
MKRLIFITLLTLLVGGAGLCGYVWWKTRSAPHIAARGGRTLSIRLPAEAAHFRQNDPRWGAEKLGRTSETIKSVGCAMCSVASAAQYLGETTDPPTLNRALEAGQYSVVKFFLPMGIPHWVIVVGKEGQDYLIYDPTEIEKEPRRLSEKTSGIYSLRVVRRRA